MPAEWFQIYDIIGETHLNFTIAIKKRVIKVPTPMEWKPSGCGAWVSESVSDPITYGCERSYDRLRQIKSADLDTKFNTSQTQLYQLVNFQEVNELAQHFCTWSYLKIMENLSVIIVSLIL